MGELGSSAASVAPLAGFFLEGRADPADNSVCAGGARWAGHNILAKGRAWAGTMESKPWIGAFLARMRLDSVFDLACGDGPPWSAW
jgi:hypothetical protein